MAHSSCIADGLACTIGAAGSNSRSFWIRTPPFANSSGSKGPEPGAGMFPYRIGRQLRRIHRPYSAAQVLWRSTDFILITATSTGSALTVDCRSCRWDDCSLKVLRRSTVLNSQFIVRLAVGCRSTACHHGHAAIPDRAHTLHHRQLCCNALFSMASRLLDPQAPKLSQKNRILDNGSYHE